MFLQLAWRNIWRNPRRTTVIMIAIIIGVWAMILLGALMRGIVGQMVENNISTLTGDVQIHRLGYRDDPGVENSITEPESVEAALKSVLPPGATWASRVRVNAIASTARHSGGITLVGIDPPAEERVSFIGPTAIAEGRYLTRDDEHGIVVGEALVEKFESRLGHKLVLMSQDVDKEIASRAFRIVGVFHAEMEGTEKQFAFVTRSAAQEMLGLGSDISEVSISLEDHGKADQVAGTLKTVLAAEYEIHTWKELLPLITIYLDMYDTFVFIWYLVVFISMSFGIVNTTLMAVFERMREFGLLKALGMKPWWIIREVLTESLFLLAMGMIIGNIIGFLSVWALAGSGIDLSSMAAGAEYAGMSRVIYPAVIAKDVVGANLVVLVLGLLVD